jgi:hypothetical protein
MKMERERHLERELQREASAERPRFSATRHARIMQAVANSPAASPTVRGRAHLAQPLRTLPWLAVAASVLVAAFLTGWYVSRQAREETPLPAVAEMRPAITVYEQPFDGIDDPVKMLELALDEIRALSQLQLVAQIKRPVDEMPRSITSDDREAEKTPAMTEVDELTIEQWGDLAGDARLLASLLTSSLPHDLVDEQGTSVP